MKKFLTVFAAFLIIMCINVFAVEDISIYLDGNMVSCDPAPTIVNNRTLIPARAVFEEMGASVSWIEETRTVRILYKNINIQMVIDSDVALVDGAEVKLDCPAVIVNDRTMIPLRFVGEALGATVSWDDGARKVSITSPDINLPPIIIEDIEFFKKDEYDLFTMTSSGKATIQVLTLSGPTRLVLDIQNASLSEKNANYEGGCISAVRYGAHENFVRFVAENSELPGYIITDNSGFVEIKLFGKQKNFDYIGMAENVLIFREGATVSFESGKNKELSFKVSEKLVNETVSIGDELIESVVSSDKKITVRLKKDANYEIKGNRIFFTEKEPQAEIKEETSVKTGLIVLDAGHGGNDPGTLGYDEDGKTIIANEKDMNLTITLMVYEILKSQNIDVILTRKDDVYVGLKERAVIANEHNAQLFVSIHNNSIPDSSYHGSMVLYSLESSGGKILATNILREMTSSAGTEDKGLRDGTNMSVIKNTTMPAVIVECGCLTNKEELNNLMDIDFLYKLAEGIAEGILLTMGK